jgi:hypothetical protein
MEDREEEIADWQPPENCWVVLMGSVRFIVDDEEYRIINQQLPEPHTALSHAIYIRFNTILGEAVEMPYDAYYGMFRSTKETRARDGLWTEKATTDERMLTRKKY